MAMGKVVRHTASHLLTTCVVTTTLRFDASRRELPLVDVAEEARRYERVGFDDLWSVETRHDPFFPLLQAALVTERQVGTDIAMAFERI